MPSSTIVAGSGTGALMMSVLMTVPVPPGTMPGGIVTEKPKNSQGKELSSKPMASSNSWFLVSVPLPAIRPRSESV